MLNFYIVIFLGILLVIFLNNLKHKIISSKNYFFVFIMGFLTTLPHELAHFIVALILGAKPKGITLIPRKIETPAGTYWTFGSVKAYTNNFSGFFVGIAPIINLFIGVFVAEYFFSYKEFTLENIIFFFFIEWILIENGIPSSTDLKIAFSSYIGLIVTLFILVIGGLYYNGKTSIF